MARFILIAAILTGIVACFGFYNSPSASQAQQVKQLYLKHTAEFTNAAKELQAAIADGNEKNIRRQFLKTRAAYKQMETMVEYFFHFYASKLTGCQFLILKKKKGMCRNSYRLVCR